MTLSTPARGVPYGIFAEYRSNAEDVPNSVSIIAFGSNLGHIVRRKTRKRVGHPDPMRTWCEGNMMGAR